MEITLAVVVISLVFFIAICLIGYGICDRSDDFIGIGVVGIVIVLAATGVRAINIESEKDDAIDQQRYELCVKEGKEAVEIFGTKVCKI